MQRQTRNLRLGLLLAAAALIASGCASVPAPLEGQFSPVTPEQASDDNVGERVRWGGSIVDTRPGSNETCVEILGHGLDRFARPVEDDLGQGRFLACRDGFEDPAILESGRDITVIGTLTGFVEGRIGDFSYVYPRVGADTLFLWDDRDAHRYYQDPFWYHHPWRPWHYPYYYDPRLNFSGHIVIGL